MLFLGTASGLAQSASPTFRSESSLVLVPTLVTDRNGRVIFGLQEKDFVLLDNGVPQKITLDETLASRPISLVVAVQRSTRATEVLGAGCGPATAANAFSSPVRKCSTPLHSIALMLENFLDAPGSEIALLSFDSHVTQRSIFTQNVDSVTHMLEQLPSGDSGSAILDAVRQSMVLLNTTSPAQRRVLVIVSERTDRSSSTASIDAVARQITSTNTELYMMTIADADDGKEGLRMAARIVGPMLLSAIGGPPPQAGRGTGTSPLAGAPLSGTNATQISGGSDGVAPYAPGTFQASFSLASHGGQTDIPQTLANLTGGEYVLFNDRRGLEEALEMLTNHIHNRYQISYRPPDSPGLHRIRVRMREAMEVQIAARTNYLQLARIPCQDPAAKAPAPSAQSDSFALCP